LWIRIHIEVKSWIQIHNKTNTDPQHCFEDQASHLGNFCCTVVNVCFRLVMYGTRAYIVNTGYSFS
jgi:hypothetical protein